MDGKKIITAVGAIVGFVVLSVLLMEHKGALVEAYEGFFSKSVNPPYLSPYTGAFVLTLAVPVGIFVVGLLACWIAWAKNKLRAQFYLWVGFLVAELVFYFFWVLMWFGVPPPPGP